MNQFIKRKNHCNDYFAEKHSDNVPRKRNSVGYALIFNRLLAILAIASSICYIFMANDLSIKGIVLNKLKNETLALKEEKKDLELRMTELESFGNISRRAQEIKMVKVDKIEYISVGADTVAKK